MIRIAEHREGCILPVRAQPGARRRGIVGEHHGALKIAVLASPEKGKANAALLDVLSDVLDLSRSQIVLAGGLTSRDKTFLIRGVAPHVLQRRLAELLKGF